MPYRMNLAAGGPRPEEVVIVGAGSGDIDGAILGELSENHSLVAGFNSLLVAGRVYYPLSGPWALGSAIEVLPRQKSLRISCQRQLQTPGGVGVVPDQLPQTAKAVNRHEEGAETVGPPELGNRHMGQVFRTPQTKPAHAQSARCHGSVWTQPRILRSSLVLPGSGHSVVNLHRLAWKSTRRCSTWSRCSSMTHGRRRRCIKMQTERCGWSSCTDGLRSSECP